jgi:hypothetical protein
MLPDDAWRLADAARAPVACFFYDFGAPFDRPVDAATAPYIERLQHADMRVFCWDRQAVEDLGRFGVAAEYLPMAVNDAMFCPPVDGRARDLPIVFSGGPTPERLAALRPLAARGRPSTATMRRAGPPMRRWHPATAACSPNEIVFETSTNAPA